MMVKFQFLSNEGRGWGWEDDNIDPSFLDPFTSLSVLSLQPACEMVLSSQSSAKPPRSDSVSLSEPAAIPCWREAGLQFPHFAKLSD